MLVFDAIEPRSLIVTAPALFMTFVYCECMRYVLIVRWYGRLAGEARAESNTSYPAAA